MEDVHSALNRYIKGSYRFGINENVARFLLSHLEKIPKMKLSEVAEQCNVSTPSIIRFCRELGYQDYRQFKQAVSADMRIKEEHQIELSRDFTVTEQKDDFKEEVKHLLSEMNKDIAAALMKLDLERLKSLATDILQYEYVYMFGSDLSALFAEYLRIQLVMQHKMLISMNLPNYGVPLTNEKANTLSIIVSQHNHFIDRNPTILPYLETYSDKVWLITQETPQKSYCKKVNETLFVSGNKKMNLEYHSMLCVADLLSSYCKKLS